LWLAICAAIKSIKFGKTVFCGGPNYLIINLTGCSSPKVTTEFFNIFVSVAAASILPALAYAGTDNGKGNYGQNNDNQNGQ
jgi:hypothetical protein